MKVDTMVLCPACECRVTVQDDLELEDCLVCDQCDEALTVVSLEPLVLMVDEDDLEDDEDDDDDAFLGDDEADDEIYDEEDEDEGGDDDEGDGMALRFEPEDED